MTQAEFDELKGEIFEKVTDMIFEKIVSNPILMKDPNVEADYVARLLKITDSYTNPMEDYSDFDVQDFVDRLAAVEIIEKKQ
jgi:hypothetical protein